MRSNKYVVATIKKWNIDIFNKVVKAYPGEWHLISAEEDLTFDAIKAIDPPYIFFPHWSWIVPADIINAYECVCFHASDVPFGRGGSPIQNLIIRGLKKTKMSALRMTQELDAGAVYLKRALSLEGRAQKIYEESALVIACMIKEIIDNEPIPTPQTGEVVVFKRRKDSENILPSEGDLELLYNHIRMLDAESYPHSYLKNGRFCLEFTKPTWCDGKLIATVEIKEGS